MSMTRTAPFAAQAAPTSATEASPGATSAVANRS